MDGYEHYDLQDEDPYLIPGSTCLKNLLGITETRLLLEAEAEISAAALAELIASPVEPTFDLNHLCRIHASLFGDVYPWAGKIRKTEISKGDKLFLPYTLIESMSNEVFADLRQEDCLQNLDMLQSLRWHVVVGALDRGRKIFAAGRPLLQGALRMPYGCGAILP